MIKLLISSNEKALTREPIGFWWWYFWNLLEILSPTVLRSKKLNSGFDKIISSYCLQSLSYSKSVISGSSWLWYLKLWYLILSISVLLWFFAISVIFDLPWFIFLFWFVLWTTLFIVSCHIFISELFGCFVSPGQSSGDQSSSVQIRLLMRRKAASGETSLMIANWRRSSQMEKDYDSLPTPDLTPISNNHQ